MEVRPSSEIGLPDLLNEALQALEANVDKTEIDHVDIRSADDYDAVAEAMIEDKRQIAYVEQTLDPFKALAFKIHKAISTKLNEYAQYGKSRYEKRDRAASDWSKEQERKQREEEERLREAARLEEEARRKAEAAELKKRGDTQAAKAVLSAPIREIPVSLGPSKTKANVKGFGSRDDFKITVLDEEALILAIGRRPAYEEIAKLITTEFAKRKTAKPSDVIRFIFEQAFKLPQIPINVVKPHEAAIKTNAKATAGKINWPGVAVENERKSTTRIR